MIQETLFNANAQDRTAVRRAFGWVLTFKDYPAGSVQTVRGAEMMTEAVTLFTRGRAEFWLNGERRGDRVPGILSSEHEPVGIDGEFKLIYTERTSRVCIPASINRNRLPKVKKIILDDNETRQFEPRTRLVVCTGSISVQDRIFNEQDSIEICTNSKVLRSIGHTILLDFTNA